MTNTPQDLSDRLEKATLREANEARQKEWPHGGVDLSFFGNELAGEVGEACNIIKKLERERLGIRGSRASIAQLAEELADVVICVDLIAMRVGVELDEAVRAKFNATSIKYGLQTRLVSLRRSAPASGEIITLDWEYQYRNHVSNGEWRTTGFNDGEGSPKSRAEALAGLEKRSKPWITGSEFRLIETSSVVVSDVIRTPSGKTGEGAGS